MIIAGCMLRLEWNPDLRNFLLAATIGVVAGWLVLTRPPHYPSVLVLLALFVATGVTISVRRGWSWAFLLPVVSALFFAVIITPRHFACYMRSHTLCFFTPEDRARNLGGSLAYSRVGPRTYGVLHLDTNGKLHNYQITVPDALFISRFGCVVGESSDLRGLFDCYGRNLRYLPAYFGKKLISLFDNYHLNAYAAAVTTRWQIALNRFFATIAWLGFVGMIGLGIGQMLRCRLDLRIWLVFMYGLTYLGVMLLFHIEARFGFPFVPFALFFFIAIFQWMIHARPVLWVTTLAICLLAGTVFLWQVNAWDRSDYLINGGDPDVPPSQSTYVP
jgi:hypothetical protein